jgi:peptidoglycan/LPS O-acetylase OafA/YrhL
MNETKKLGWIDALRGYAVLGTVVIHSTLGERDMFLHQLWGLGAKGVQLFYAVSALTLFMSFYNRDERSTTNFFIRRFFRIAPMFYMLIIYGIVVYTAIPNEHHQVTLSNVASHFLVLHDVGPQWQNSLVDGGWSVGVEVLFYMLCPLLFAYISNIGGAVALYFGAVAVGLIFNGYFTAHPLIDDISVWETYLYEFLPTQLHVFAAGIVIYFILRSKAGNAIRQMAVVMLPAVVCLILQLYGDIKFSLLPNMLVCLCFIPACYLLSGAWPKGKKQNDGRLISLLSVAYR